MYEPSESTMFQEEQCKIYEKKTQETFNKSRSYCCISVKTLFFLLVTSIIIIIYFLIFPRIIYNILWKPPLSVQIPITYVWVGSKLPPRYLQKVEWLSYPHKILNDSDWDLYKDEYEKYNITAPVVKSDILRLEYIYHHGGIYADLDLVIDYPCLMKILPYQGTYFGRDIWQKVIDQVSNNFIYSPEPHSPAAKKQLDKGQKNPLFIAGPGTLKALDKIQVLPNAAKCMTHLYHGGDNWAKDTVPNTNQHIHLDHPND